MFELYVQEKSINLIKVWQKRILVKFLFFTKYIFHPREVKGRRTERKGYDVGERKRHHI